MHPQFLAPKRLTPKLFSPILSLSLLFGGAALAIAPPALAETKVASKSVWSALNVNDGGFSILMPGVVDRRVNTPELLGKPTEQTLLLASQERHDAFYMVAWSDLSVGPNLDAAGQTKVLELARESFLRSFKGKQLEENINFKLGGNPGKQFAMVSDVKGRKFVIRSRSYLVGSRLYHVLAAVPQDRDSSLIGSTQGFLKSFQLDPHFNPPQNIAQTPTDLLVDVPAPKAPATAVPAEQAEPLVQDPAAQRLF